MTKNWSQIDNTDYRKVWKYNNRELYIYLTHSSDHYERDENGDSKQVTRWKGQLKIGTTITVNVHKYSICDDKSKKEAFNEVDAWRINLMEKFDSDFEQTIKELDIEDALIEYEEYVDN